MRRIVGGAGVALVLFGAFRLVTEVPLGALVGLAGWLGAAVVLHDGALAPLTLAVAAVLRRAVRPRARRYVQAALVTGVGVTAVALPLLLRRGTQPAQKALLQQDYGRYLTWVWAGVGGVFCLLYAVRVLSDRRASKGR